MADQKKELAEDVLDFVVAPLTALALVNRYIQDLGLPEGFDAFAGWIIAGGLAWFAVKWARGKKTFK